jgi:hypothetical protein
VREQFRRCLLCGRLAAALEGDFCSDRCAALADEGYASPTHSRFALRPPTSTFDVRVTVTGPIPEALPQSCIHLGAVGNPRSGRQLVRFGAEDWDEIETTLAELRDSAGEERVQLFTLQRFARGGLGPPRGPRPSSDWRSP